MSLVWCVVGLLIGFARPEQPTVRLASGAAVTTGLNFLQGAFSQILFSFHPLHVVLGFHFFARFPVRPSPGWNQRTDIFALAVMVIESLTGRKPFESDTLADLFLAQQTTYRLPGSSTQARALGDLLQQCLAVDPRDRVSSAATLRGALIPLLRACPPQEFTIRA